MTVLINVVLPVFLVAGLAALAQTRLRLNVQTVSRATFYLFAPALVFDGLVSSNVGAAEFGRIVATVLLITVVLWVLGTIASRMLKLQGPTQAAFLAAILLMNAGNYGLPVNLFAFGEAGLARASVYFTVSALLSSSLGVFLTARGHASTTMALRRMARVPLAYTAIIGLVVNLGQFTVPEPLLKAIHLLGQASVPSMLVVLGVKLTETFRSRQRAFNLPALGTVAVLRLVLAPALAWAVTWALGLNGLDRSVTIVESAMPTAVMTTILATEFESDPPFAAMCVLVTTLGSLLTLTLLLNRLM
jgi:malate permease and related proteins